MGETIMVLFAFFVLLGIGLVLYAQYQKASMQRQAIEFFEREAVRISVKMAFYPELACSDGGVINENCFDLHKAVAFSRKMTPGEEYDENFFLFYETELRDSRIYIEQLFPAPDNTPIPFEKGEQENEDESPRFNRITLYDRAPSVDEETSWEQISTFVPLTLRSELRNKAQRDALGMLVVESYRTRFS